MGRKLVVKTAVPPKPVSPKKFANTGVVIAMICSILFLPLFAFGGWGAALYIYLIACVWVGGYLLGLGVKKLQGGDELPKSSPKAPPKGPEEG